MGGAPSAHGLFRATGKTSKPVAVQTATDLGGDFEIVEHRPREKNDFYPTPPEPTLAFGHHEYGRLSDLTRFGAIWEPACGDGRMMFDLRSCGLPVVGSDLIDRDGGAAELQDFFAFGHNSRLGDVIVTNPPFHLVNWRDGKGRWITHALEVLGVRYMALLLPHGWPAAGGLEGILAKHPPSREYLMAWKIDFTGQGAPPMLNAWFVWDLDGPDPRGWRKRLMYKADAQKAGQGVLV